MEHLRITTGLGRLRVSAESWTSPNNFSSIITEKTIQHCADLERTRYWEWVQLDIVRALTWIQIGQLAGPAWPSCGALKACATTDFDDH